MGLEWRRLISDSLAVSTFNHALSRGSLLCNVYDKTDDLLKKIATIIKSKMLPQNHITLINIVKYNDIMHKDTHKKMEEKVSHSLLLMKNEAACMFA